VIRQPSHATASGVGPGLRRGYGKSISKGQGLVGISADRP
jgi:hypothetical protein